MNSSQGKQKRVPKGLLAALKAAQTTRYKARIAEDNHQQAKRAFTDLLEKNGLRERTWACMSSRNPGNHITPKNDGSPCIFCGIACWDNDIDY